MRECKSCDSNCKTCYGPLPQNCLSCDISQKVFWFISVCITTCPNGTYSDISTPNNPACTICDIDKHCYTCQLDTNSNLKCLNCKYGYFFNSTDGTCSNTCIDTYYPDIITNKC